MSGPGSHRMYSISGVLLALVISLPVPPLIAEVYKWLDTEGRVHCGDKPGNVNAVTIKTTNLKPPADTNLLHRQQEQQRLLESIAETCSQKEKKQADNKAAQALQQSNCEKARDRLTGMQNSRFLYEKTSDPDNPRILSQDEYDTAVDSALHDVDVWCNAGKD